MTTFTDILSKPSTEVERPKIVPRGTYVGIVQGQFKEFQAKSGTTGIEFSVALLQPHSDIDQNEFAAAFPNGLNGRTVRHTVWVGEDGGFYLKEFLTKTLGLEEGPSIGELLAQAPGRQLLVTMKHIPSTRGEHMISVPDSVAAV